MNSNKSLKLKDICKNYSFFEFLILTGAYKELWGTESRWAIFSTVITSIILFCTAPIVQNAYDLISVIAIFAPASIGLIGFLFSGLALMAAIISVKTINVIDKNGKVKHIAGILFSFYYCSGIILSALILSGILYLYLRTLELDYLSIYANKWIMYILVILIIYAYIYSIYYTIALLGACLKLFFLNVYYKNKISDEENRRSQ